jgi:hypothetical protein
MHQGTLVFVYVSTRLEYRPVRLRERVAGVSRTAVAGHLDRFA